MNMRDWMMELREQEGKLTPEIVLEAARPPDSPAHQFVFHCPVEEAAEAHYLERAHQLIRLVKVKVEAPLQEEPRRVRAFHYVVDAEGEGVYEPVEVIVRSVDKFAQVRAAALQRLNEAQDALVGLEMLAQEKTRKTAVRKATTIIQEARDLVETT